MKVTWILSDFLLPLYIYYILIVLPVFNQTDYFLIKSDFYIDIIVTARYCT